MTYHRTDSDHRDVYAIVTEQITAALEAGTAPWRKPWDPAVGMPRSLTSGKPYRGVNVWLLKMSAEAAGYASPWWGTYDQIAERGGQVKRGERGSFVVFWKRGEHKVTDPETGESEIKPTFILRYYKVFNAEQSEPGLKVPALAVREHVEPEGAAEAVMAGYFENGGPRLTYGGPEAYYMPSADSITLPIRDSFESADAFYGAAFHEMTHSTGHESRLNRREHGQATHFGDEMYAREELVAEMGAAMLCGVAGISSTLPNSAAYLANWLHALKDDNRLVVTAAAQAQRAADWIQGTQAAELEAAA